MDVLQLKDNLIKRVETGELPNFIDYFRLYNHIKNIKFENDERYEKYINILTDAYKKASYEEKAIINNLLFLLEMFNKENKLEDFFVRTLKLYQDMSKSDIKLALDFLASVEIEDEVFLSGIRRLFNEFFDLDEIEKRSIFVNLLSVIWNNRKFFNNSIWLEIFDDLVDLLNECIKRDLIDNQMYIHFFTYHIYGNNIKDIKEWEVFNEKVEKPASKFYKEWGNKHLTPIKPQNKEKKVIGILLDRLVLNSPFVVLYSLLKSLTINEEFNKKYKIIVYSMNYLDKQQEDQKVIQTLYDINVDVITPQNFFIDKKYYYSHLEKALWLREVILKDGVDYLISWFGYDIPNFLFSVRVAPKQLFWSHMNCTSEIENIDLRISHFPQVCKKYKWKIFHVSIANEFLMGSEGEKEVAKIIKQDYKKRFGENTVILGTIGRLVKLYSEPYMKLIAKIMKENPNTIYLACGVGNEKQIKELLKKCEIDEERFLFLGQVNPHIYGYVIEVWINTFPAVQGQSQIEYHAKGSGVIFQGDVITNCNDKNDYDLIKKDYFKRKEFFAQLFELSEDDISQIDENVSLNRLILDLYKKYHNVDKSILECIEFIDSSKDCKEKWYRMLDCSIKNKAYFEMYRWFVYRKWSMYQEYKIEHNDFIELIENL
jgi:hypothetical protein